MNLDGKTAPVYDKIITNSQLILEQNKNFCSLNFGFRFQIKISRALIIGTLCSQFWLNRQTFLFHLVTHLSNSVQNWVNYNQSTKEVPT